MRAKELVCEPVAMKSGLDAFERLLARDPMEVLLPLAIFAATFLVAWLARRVTLRALNGWSSRTDSRAGRVLYYSLRGPTRVWILILAVHVAFQASDLPAKFAQLGANVLLVLWILSLTVMSMRLVGDLVRTYGAQIPGAAPVTTLSQTLAQIVVVILGGLILL